MLYSQDARETATEARLYENEHHQIDVRGSREFRTFVVTVITYYHILLKHWPGDWYLCAPRVYKYLPKYFSD